MPNNPKMIGKFCLVCNSKFSVRNTYHKRGIGNYCSPKCRGHSRKGIPVNRDQTGDKNPNWKGGISLVESVTAYRENNPKKIRCHRQLQNAVKIGRIKRMPCEVCGDHKSQGHHCDYNKPYDVMWLCQKHHSQWHVKHGEGKNA